jgi:predicted  nucleic acid-binding Zn-ribbon protein
MPRNPALQALLALHKVDQEIERLGKQKTLSPVSLRRIHQRLESQRDSIEAKKEQLRKLRAECHAKEVLLKSAEQEIQALTLKLNQAKSNKEYTAVEHERTTKRTDASRIEDAVLMAMANIDALAAEIREGQAGLKEIEREHADESKKVDEAVAKFDTSLAQLQRRRAEAAEAVDPELLQEYERIAAKKGASAVAPVVSGSCQGCFMQLPPQVRHTVDAGTSVVTCPSCSRLLYVP